MKKISKSVFTETITSAPSIFCGVFTTNALFVDDLADALARVDRASVDPESMRHVVSSRPTFIEFSDESRLYLDGNEYFSHGDALAVVIHGGSIDKVILYQLVTNYTVVDGCCREV